MSSKRRLLRGSYQNIIDLYEGTPDNIRIEGENWYKDANVIAQNVGDILLEKAVEIGADLVLLMPSITEVQHLYERALDLGLEVLKNLIQIILLNRCLNFLHKNNGFCGVY